MVVTFKALNHCWHYRREIREADNVDALDELMADRTPMDRLFARDEFFQCKSLVERFDEFPGWRTFRVRAALAGDIPSKIEAARDFYVSSSGRPREDYPYSPAGFLIDALTAKDDLVFAHIATWAKYSTILKDTSPTTITAWWLLYGKYSQTCDKTESMKALCSVLSPECARFRTLGEKIRSDAGSDEVYAAAQRLADELYLAVEEQRFDDLGINLVW